MADRAKKIGVNQPAILYALKRIKITIKRNNFVIEKEIEKKGLNIIINYELLSKKLEVKALYLLISQDSRIIKTVFMPGQKKRKKVYGKQEQKRGKRENLVAGRIKKRFNSTNYI